MNWMIPAIRWAQAGFFLILVLLVMLASLLFVSKFLRLGPYSVFRLYFILLLAGIRSGLPSPSKRSLLGDLLQCIALLGLFAIIAEQLDDLRSLIKNVEADAAAAAALETTSAWRSLWAVQPRERLRAAIRLTPDYTCLHVANIDLVEGFEDG